MVSIFSVCCLIRLSTESVPSHYGGALLLASNQGVKGGVKGGVYVTNSHFFGNRGDGLFAGTISGDVRVVHIIANNNSDVGADLHAQNGSVSVARNTKGANTFNGNLEGMDVSDSGGSISLSNFTASNNGLGNGNQGTGLIFEMPVSSATLTCATISSNTNYGILGMDPSGGTLTLNSVTMAGNVPTDIVWPGPILNGTATCS